jgi:hypothetical protein
VITNRLSILLGLLLVASAPAADTITGQVVDSNGVGIPNVNIDAFDVLSGDAGVLNNDGTDGLGFFTTTIPAGLWDLRFVPPAPPGSSYLADTRDGVVVVGSVNLGTITLADGFALTGTCLTQGGLPVANVNLDVLDELTGEELIFQLGSTDAFGNFAVAVPGNLVELRLDTRPVTFQILAPLAIGVTATGPTDLGNVTLLPGFDVSGVVLRSGGQAATNTDMDVRGSLTGDKLWTPGDNTGSEGEFSIRLPAGTWDVEACPKFSSGLRPVAVRNVVVADDVNVGTLVASTGVPLTGNIVGHDGSNQAGADVDLMDAQGLDVFICGDNADPNGDYAVIIPTGVHTISFEPTSFLVPYGADLHPGVNVTGALVLDGVLPACLSGQNYGTGLAGTGGFVPHLTDGGGSPRVDNDADYFWSLENGKGSGTVVLMISAGQLNVPVLGGTLLVNILPGQYSGFVLVLDGAAGVGGAGSAQFPLPLPIAQLAGFTLYGQFAVLDSAAPSNIALSEGMSVQFCF